MTTFNATNGAFVPSLTNDNLTLDMTGQTYLVARVMMVTWGGSNTSSAGYRTRWTRPTTGGTGAKTSITIASMDPNYNTAGATVQSTYGTSQPVLAADPGANLYATDWNNQGGTGQVILPQNNPWVIVGGILTGQLSCRNTKGTDASLSSYTIYWDE